MQQLCLYHLSTKVRTTGCTLGKMHQDREDCAKLTDYVTKTWIEGRLSPIYLESLPDWGTQNHQPSKVLAQQVEKEGENCTFFNLWDYWRIQGGADTKWSKDVGYAAGGKRRKTVKKYQEVEERLQRLKTQLTSGVKNSIQYGDSAFYILKLD